MQASLNEEFSRLEDYINALPNKKGVLISVLHKAQEIFGYLPPQVQDFIAEKLGISAAKVYGVVTFYSFFTMEKKGRYQVSVCMGTACFVKGAEGILEEFKKLADADFSVDALRCIGACGLAPVVTVNGKYYGRVKKADVAGIVAETKREGSKHEG